MAEPVELSERERALLTFEGTWWTLDDEKATMIAATFDCTLDDYYQELNRLAEIPAALDHDPLVVRRILRQRDRRRRARASGSSVVDQPREGINP